MFKLLTFALLCIGVVHFTKSDTPFLIPTEQPCAANQTFFKCGLVCPQICGVNFECLTTICGKSGCFCSRGYVSLKHPDGTEQCIKKEDCKEYRIGLDNFNPPNITFIQQN